MPGKRPRLFALVSYRTGSANGSARARKPRGGREAAAMSGPTGVRRRVLVWHWGRRGGGPRYTLELARALAARGDLEVHLSYAPQAEIRAEYEALGLPGLPVDTYRGAAEAALASLRLPLIRHRFARYLRDHRIDTVIGTMNHVWDVAVAPAIRPAGARLLYVLHDGALHPGEESALRAWSFRRVIGLADGMVTLSGHVRDQLTALYGYPPERSRVIPHGVFAFGDAPPRRHPSADGRPLRLLFFGRILPYKGLDLLLDAYAALRARTPEGAGPGVELIVAGSGDLAPYAGRLAGLPGVTLDHRWIAEEEMPSILERADLVVLPYREASQSGVAACAYGAGLPVVATPVGGLTEQIRHGETGLLAEAVTAEALAGAIDRFATDPALYEAASRAALAHAEGALSWRAVAAGFAEAVAALPPLRG